MRGDLLARFSPRQSGASMVAALTSSCAASKRVVQVAPGRGELPEAPGWLLFLEGQRAEAHRYLEQSSMRLPTESALHYYPTREAQCRAGGVGLRLALLTPRHFAELPNTNPLL